MTNVVKSKEFFKLIVDGFKREIRPEDVWDLNPRDSGKRINPEFDNIWQQEKNRVNDINATNFPELFTPRDKEGRKYPLHGAKRRRIRQAVRYRAVVSERSSLIGGEDVTLGGAGDVRRHL
ncbi:ATP-binding cassette transporter subfamily C member 1beta [Elysia marginata]|uniref:ATP-binding cassette transporter subfamily C member 1beta n=1 Tax=Elysia marginata TaxID=1093978 RepID=A0AAV4JD39_9GAST|nr:ATP-binding cassette transporter subfamily C member 1beta [Elysia marginata]